MKNILLKKALMLFFWACFLSKMEAAMPCDTIIIDTLNQRVFVDEDELDEIKSVKVVSKISLVASFLVVIAPFFPEVEGTIFLVLILIALLLGIFSKMKINRYKGLRKFMDKDDPLANSIKDATELAKAAIRFSLLPLLAALLVSLFANSQDDFLVQDYFVAFGGLSLLTILVNPIASISNTAVASGYGPIFGGSPVINNRFRNPNPAAPSKSDIIPKRFRSRQQ
jgi:hypothetical protein